MVGDTDKTQLVVTITFVAITVVSFTVVVVTVIVIIVLLVTVLAIIFVVITVGHLVTASLMTIPTKNGCMWTPDLLPSWAG